MDLAIIEWTGKSETNYSFQSHELNFFDTHFINTTKIVYIITRKDTDMWIPLVIGYSDDPQGMPFTEKELECAKKHSATHYHYHRNSSKIEIDLEIEDLKGRYSFICNQY